MSELVDSTQNDKAQISRSAKALIAKGYVQKQDNPLDKRSSLLSLTDSGRELYEQVIPVRQETQNLLLEKLTTEEREVTERAIQKLTTYLLDHPELVVAAE